MVGCWICIVTDTSLTPNSCLALSESYSQHVVSIAERYNLLSVSKEIPVQCQCVDSSRVWLRDSNPILMLYVPHGLGMLTIVVVYVWLGL